MKSIKTPILPTKQTFIDEVGNHNDLHLEAICVYVTTGFFMGEDTFWKGKRCALPGHRYDFEDNGSLKEKRPWFQWSYNPRDISFDQALEEYIELFAQITKDQIGDNNVILPLSGGLDSRSQAMILKNFDNSVQAYSYSFKGGYPEHKISQQIADVCGFKFTGFEISKGYLWNCIDELAKINQCYSEFTHPRQMGVLPQLKEMEGVFSLGHWGDVFFDRGVPEGTTEADVIPMLFKKMVKPDGLALAERLWAYWNLEGNFKDYFVSRLEVSLAKIEIDNLSAKVRAFKTSQWAHRWTTTNLSVFKSAHPITLPYYDDRMCQFICTVPEAYLADRRLQIAHLKQGKALSNITWHAQKPFNINTYTNNKLPYNLPYRIGSKLHRTFNGIIGNPYIQRNFELQFLGANNDAQLKHYIFDQEFLNFIPKSIVEDCYRNFNGKNYVHNAHALSMLLTMSLWCKHFYNK
ncbi:asparagine synthase-related protein [Sediminibacter sp. Hel_I_10]|uniref:asparagine synthase-related protein n=1 Tax=Sediminibacter sp. Hel_I_10 TaxID=1392490 RepID=UPI00047AF596|nr:asparagine synthase-related protein [Sediminibacter sp. Hel_I_10]